MWKHAPYQGTFSDGCDMPDRFQYTLCGSSFRHLARETSHVFQKNDDEITHFDVWCGIKPAVNSFSSFFFYKVAAVRRCSFLLSKSDHLWCWVGHPLANRIFVQNLQSWDYSPKQSYVNGHDGTLLPLRHISNHQHIAGVLDRRSNPQPSTRYAGQHATNRDTEAGFCKAICLQMIWCCEAQLDISLSLPGF